MRALEDCVDAALSKLDAEARGRFPTDPLLTIRTDLGLKVREADHLTERRADGGACDGLSFLKDGVILYAPTHQSRRENFTLAHELGHWLVTLVPEIFDWLAVQLKPKPALETLCDRIAQRLLLGDGTISAVVGAGPIRAQHVLDLYASSQASMPACAIALAARLPGLGALVLVDRDPDDDDPIVRYASIRPDPVQGWPKVYPWPEQTVPAAHPLKFHHRRRAGTAPHILGHAMGRDRRLLHGRDRGLQPSRDRRSLRHRPMGRGKVPSPDSAGLRRAAQAGDHLLRTDPHRPGVPMPGLRTGLLPELGQVPL